MTRANIDRSVNRPRSSTGGPGRRPTSTFLKVAVLVALHRGATAGGHVKCWERFAEAAAETPGTVDLTLHFLGERETLTPLSADVRIKTWRPRVSTRCLPFLDDIPGHTDIAPHHPALSLDLADANVIHTTDAYFSFAGSASRVAASRDTSLVTSIHTDTPGYARTLVSGAVERLLGTTPPARWLNRNLAAPDLLYRHLMRRLIRHQKQAAFTLVSSAEQRTQADAAVGPRRVLPLERGIDFALFNPARRDRSFTEQAFAVHRDRFLIAYAGRLDCCKNVGLLFRAFDSIFLTNLNAHLILAGDGPERQRLADHFGPTASLPGTLDQDTAARLMASADLFVFPSELETFANVVRESLTAGTGALVSDRGFGAGDVISGVNGLYLPPDDPAAWRNAVAKLAAAPDRAASWGRAAAAMARKEFPSWRDVLTRDLIPVWQRAAGRRGVLRSRQAA